MKWCCFLFWFIYRLVLACLAHFNWCVALYTNCAYFWIWKSYDLLWFWMHLMLCSCFPQLRRENYLIVWCNLIYKRWKQYPNLTYKQLYLALYGGKGTKAERALQRMDTIETRERESRRLRKLSGASSSSSSSDEEIQPTTPSIQNNYKPLQVTDKIMEEEDKEARKYVYLGEAVDSQADLESRNEEAAPVPPPRRNKPSDPSINSPNTQESSNPTNGTSSVTFNVENAEGEDDASSEDSDTNSTTGWIQKFPMPKMIRNKLRRSNVSNQSQASDANLKENEETSSISAWSKIRAKIPNPFNRSASSVSNPNELDILRPDFTNTYDVRDPSKAAKRARRDKRLLTVKVRKRLREELKEAARIERKRKMVTDSIELLLQLLRMMASFAILIGNIRKTFIPAQFKYLKPGQHPYDNYELLILFRITTFMDVSMFWMNVMWVYCLQWHLCCRLGFFRFWAWAALLGFIASVVMLIPMSFVMEQMDLSWCRFRSNTTLEKYQPSW